MERAVSFFPAVFYLKTHKKNAVQFMKGGETEIT